MVTPIRASGTIWPPRSTTTYVLGSGVGALTTTSFLYVLSTVLDPIPKSLAIALSILVAMYGIVLDATNVGLPRPGGHKQVPSSIISEGQTGSFGFGFTMGSGLVTFTTTSAPWVAAGALTLLRPTPIAFFLAGLSFGFARGAVHLNKWFSRDIDWQSGLNGLMERSSPLRMVSSLAALLTIVTVLLGGVD